MLVVLCIGVLLYHAKLHFGYILIIEIGVGHLQVLESTHGEVRIDRVLTLFGVVSIGGEVLEINSEETILSALGEHLNLL